MNNENYFNSIEETYQRHGKKKVRIVDINACIKCEIRHSCCAVGEPNFPLTIENSGKEYRLCKVEQYENGLALFKQKQDKERQERIRLDLMFEEMRQKREREIEKEKEIEETKNVPQQHRDFVEIAQEAQTNVTMTQLIPIVKEKEDVVPQKDGSPKSCLDCRANLKWKDKKDGWAHCGCYISMGLPQDRVVPYHANVCSNFRRSDK